MEGAEWNEIDVHPRSRVSGDIMKSHKDRDRKAEGDTCILCGRD